MILHRAPFGGSQVGVECSDTGNVDAQGRLVIKHRFVDKRPNVADFLYVPNP